MKAVLTSIQPKWCKLIANGKKTVEVRKTRPKMETPFKCYIYESKARFIKSVKGAHMSYGYGRGKVIGEFVCDRIEEYRSYSNELSDTSCLSLNELVAYANPSKYPVRERFCLPLYGWHISELKIYDKPKKLGEFYRLLPEKVLENGDYDCRKEWDVLCMDAPEGGDFCAECPYGGRVQITRPPQSWFYVEQE